MHDKFARLKPYVWRRYPSSQSLAFNGVGQFEGQPQSVNNSIYTERVSIDPQDLKSGGIEGSPTKKFSDATKAMQGEATGAFVPSSKDHGTGSQESFDNASK